MPAPELEIRPGPDFASTAQPQELTEHAENPQAPAELGEYVQPVLPPQPQPVQDDHGQTLLAPVGTQLPADQVPYTPEQIEEAKKLPIENGTHWLAVWYGFLIKRFAFLQGRTTE